MRIEQIAIERGFFVDKDGNLFKNEKPHKFWLGHFGYHVFKINVKEGAKFKIKSCKVHRLQAYQKYGVMLYQEGCVVRHLNGNPDDNSFDNIATGTYSDNRSDIPEHIRKSLAINASKHNGKRYPKKLIENIKNDHNNGLSYNDIMKKYNISSKGTVSYICNHNYYF